MSEGKFCPFGINCVKNECAIWDSEAERCAILSIAKMICNERMVGD